jgi:hypothetical protein
MSEKRLYHISFKFRNTYNFYNLYNNSSNQKQLSLLNSVTYGGNTTSESYNDAKQAFR